MSGRATKESLGIFWHGEEVDGLLVYGYWPYESAPEPNFPGNAWGDNVEWRSRILVGDYWTVWMWEIRVLQWPAPTIWSEIIRATLTPMLLGGATLSWCGLEGFFVEPPGLLSPTEMSQGVWAAMLKGGAFYGPPPLDGVFETLSGDCMETLRALVVSPAMNYESIDPIITAWAAKHTLHIYTIYQDEEVRSVDLVGSDGRKCEFWIEAPDQSGNVQVHVWDFNKRREDCNTTVADLARCLEQVYATAMKWLG